MRTIFILFFLHLFQSSNAQIQNYDFENWTYGIDSFGFATFIPNDTFSYLKIDNWTSSNSLTGNPATGGKYLVNRSTDSHSGTYSVRLNTDSIFIAGSLNQGIIAPGFIVNGNFKFDLANIIFQSSGNVNPQNLVGAGSPISQRIDKIGAFVKYTPIAGDSLLIWAVLKKRGALVAESKFYSSVATTSYTKLEGVFNYVSCEVPDTLVVLIASSNPDFSGLLTGNSGVRPGSILLVDSVTSTPFSVGYSRPLARNYNITTFTARPKSILVAQGDTDCTGRPLTVVILGSPSHGTATVSGDTITYTSATGFSGIDTIYYSVSNGQYTSTGMIRVSVLTTGVEGIDENNISIYPNPAMNKLNVICSNSKDGAIQVIDLLGRSLFSQELNEHETSLDISGIPAGAYWLLIRANEIHKSYKFIKE